MVSRDTLLKGHNVLQTRELDEARAAVAQRYCDHQLTMLSGNDVKVVYNHVRGEHISLNVLEYGAEVAINPGELQNFYLLQLPLSGRAKIIHRGEEVYANPQSGTLLNPDRPTDMIWQRDCRKLMVQIDRAFLKQIAYEEIGGTLPGPVRFDPKVDLKGQAGRRLLALSVTAARAIEAGDILSTSQDLNLLALERQLAVTMLETQRSNISHLLKERADVSTTHLRRAVEFIRANYYDTITLEDIAQAAQVHHRTLQTAFREQLQMSPMLFLRNVRLDNARFHLLQRHNRASVSEIAYDCGYSHLGRFSRDFRDRFGHAPSQTR